MAEKEAKKTEKPPIIPPNFIEVFDKKKFGRWIERLEGAFRIYKITDENIKKDYFLHFIGAEVYDILCDLSSPEKPQSTSYKELKNLLKEHFDPTPIEIAEYYRFHHCVQHEGETIRDYLANLRRMASTCNFGSFLNTALRNQLTCGLKEKRIRDRLLEEKNLTLERAIEIAISLESTAEESKEVNEVKTKIANKKPLKCYRCGGPHYPNQCSFIDAECSYCKKKGHIRRACMKLQRRKVNMVEENKEAEDECEEMVDHLVYSNMLCEKNSDLSKIWVDAKINNCNIKMEFDSESAVSIMGEQEFKNKFPRIQLKKTNIRLRTYPNNLLNVLGVAEVAVEVNGQRRENLKLYIVSGSKTSLFGREWLRQFSLEVINAIIFKVNSVNCPVSRDSDDVPQALK